MIAVQNRSLHSALCLVLGIATTWTLLAGTGFAQTEVKPSESKAAESRPAAGDVPIPFSPSALSWLRFAFAPSHSEAPATRLPYESIREKRSPWQGSAIGQLGGVSAADLQRAVNEYARQQEEQEAQAEQEFVLPSAQQFIPADPVQAAAAQLRASARNLDSAAADLEDAGKYAEADRIRSSAQRLRREARELAKQDTDEIRVIE